MQECLPQLPLAPGTWLLLAAAMLDDAAPRRRATLRDALRHDPGLTAWAGARVPDLRSTADPIAALAQWIEEHGWQQWAAAAESVRGTLDAEQRSSDAEQCSPDSEGSSPHAEGSSPHAESRWPDIADSWPEPESRRPDAEGSSPDAEDRSRDAESRAPGAASDSGSRRVTPRLPSRPGGRKKQRRRAMLSVAVASVAQWLAMNDGGPKRATPHWAYLLGLLEGGAPMPGEHSPEATTADAEPFASPSLQPLADARQCVHEAMRRLGLPRGGAARRPGDVPDRRGGTLHADAPHADAPHAHDRHADAPHVEPPRVARAGKLLRRAAARGAVDRAVYLAARRRLAVVRSRWRGDGALAVQVLQAAVRARQRLEAETTRCAAHIGQPSAHGALDRSGHQDRLEALAEFAAGAGHEINNPLGVIIGRAQLLLRDESDPARRRDLALIAAQAERIHEMIAGLMLFARPPQPQWEPMLAQDVLAEVVREMQPRAALRDIRLESDAPDEPLRLVADRAQIGVALRELIDNALLAVGEHGHVAVQVRRAEAPPGHPLPAAAAGPAVPRGPGGDRSGEWIVFTVRDDGPGIAPDVLKHAFDPFYSGYAAGRGLGVGLCQVWAIARLHGGVVTLDSSPGCGTQSALYVPMQPQGVALDAMPGATVDPPEQGRCG